MAEQENNRMRKQVAAQLRGAARTVQSSLVREGRIPQSTVRRAPIAGAGTMQESTVRRTPLAEAGRMQESTVRRAPIAGAGRMQESTVRRAPLAGAGRMQESTVRRAPIAGAERMQESTVRCAPLAEAGTMQETVQPMQESFDAQTPAPVYVDRRQYHFTVENLSELLEIQERMERERQSMRMGYLRPFQST